MKLFKRVQSLIAKKTGAEPFAPQSAAEIAALDNNALISALCDHFLRKENHESPENFWQGLNESSKIAYSAQNYEMEVNNGGLQQYLENSSSMTVPYLSKALKVLHAESHLVLWESFLHKNNIDEASLSLIASGESQNIIDLIPDEIFEEYDNEFYKLETEETLDKLIAEYTREHIDKIFDFE